MNPAQTSRRGKIFEASNLAGGVHGVNSRSGVGGPAKAEAGATALGGATRHASPSAINWNVYVKVRRTYYRGD
jgi:hypothetical protein